MSTLDVEQMLAEVSPEDPCGPDMSYEASYYALLQSAQGTPEQQMGDSIIPGQEPNWREVKASCLELLGQTKDLRLAVVLARAVTRLSGLAGTRDALGYVAGLVERYWEHVHPLLDPEDDLDPTERVNIIAELAAPITSEETVLTRLVRETPLCESAQLGKVRLLDVAIASGELAAPKTEEGQPAPPDMGLIDATFADADLELLQDNAEAVNGCMDQLGSLTSAIAAHVDEARRPDLGPLRVLFVQAQSAINKALAERGVATEGGETSAAVTESSPSSGEGLSGEIRSTQEVLMALDKVCGYYERYEPSSPVPMLIRRAQRLVSADFVDIIRDLSPDAMRDIEKIGGIGDNG